MTPGPVLILGTMLLTGFIAGKLVSRTGLPEVTGYIMAGVLLNPQVSRLVPEGFVLHSDLTTSLTLAIITFSVGASLYLPTLKKVGRTIGLAAVLEAEFANIFIAVGFALLLPLLLPETAPAAIPLALLFGALGSPTDPSATLAVTRQYKCNGPVTKTVMGVAALDDGIGMINYSTASAAAAVILAHTAFSVNSVLTPLLRILTSLAAGGLFGWLFSVMEKKQFAKTDAGILALLLGTLYTCYGAALLVDADSLLAVMTMGFVVVNSGKWCRNIPDKIAGGLDQLVFILFFTISGMKLDFTVLASSALLVVVFVLLRVAGKMTGTALGAKLTDAPATVRKYTGFCLVPQGGIVIGLALLLQSRPEFSDFSGTLVSVILGTVIIHELAGPVLSKWALKKAGELL
ncbi:sodium:proton exchanger [Candidatus Fermentibacteria bacterium]|nr:MAG: sodium:proton exchanger [Candidatus Fermentibacteria bacterium]